MPGSRVATLLLFGAVAAVPLSAQHAGTVEIGVLGRWTDFGSPIKIDSANNLPGENGIGIGGRLGIFVVRHLEVEADASYTKVDAARIGSASYVPFHAGLTYNFPLGGKSAFLLGARYFHNSYGDAADYDDSGIGGLAGFRFGPVRVEATYDRSNKDDPHHDDYGNFGVDAGLSLLLGKHCKKAANSVTVTPSSATLDRGAKATFTASAVICGKARDVMWTATGGTITATGEYTAGMTPGSYQVTATEPKTALIGTATVIINAPLPPPPPPPPPPPTPVLQRIGIAPKLSRVKVNEPVTFTVTGYMSLGDNRIFDNCPLTATGNAIKSGNSFSWARYGTYTVTANCEGMSDQATVEVPLVVVIYETNFGFNKDELTPAGLDSVRAAADSLKKYPEINIRLAGFADFVASEEYNCGLSIRRVNTVRKALNQFGIGDERFISLDGFGKAYPIPDDQVPQAWKDINTQTHDKGKWWDRRVDITSASKDAGMVACTAAPGPVKKEP